jgi:thiamine biosynthesis lipoprotein
MTEQMQFRAMGSDAHIVVVGTDGGDGCGALVDTAYRRIGALEQRWSRFIDTSEVCALRRHAGEWVEVSPDTIRLVEHAVEGWRLSGGAFDPLVLDDVERAGYDRTFERVGRDAPPCVESNLSPRVEPCRALSPAIDIGDTAVRIPPGSGFDPGGIGKGLAADLVVAELLAAGADGACVNLGGDLRVAGRAPAPGDWTIAVEDPWSRDTLVEFDVADGGIATSSTARRRWMAGATVQHHLIDPATGAPSTTDLVAVTIVAGAGWTAEVLAKAALLRGTSRWTDVLPPGVEGMAVATDGSVLSTAGLARFSRCAAPLVS